MARHNKTVIPLLHEVGQPQTQLVIANLIQDAKQKDLQMPARLCTFDQMLFDEAVYTGHKVTTQEVKKAIVLGQAKGFTAQGKIHAERINYNLHNLSYGSWSQAVNDILTYCIYGYSLLNTPVELRPGKGYCLTKISPRSQKSVYGWLWDENYSEVIGFVQRPNTHTFSSHAEYKEKESFLNWSTKTEKDYTVLKRSQYLHFTANSTLRNPQGDSTFAHAYQPWAEKKAVEKLEIIGAGKDLGGMFKLTLPTQLIAAANDPENNPIEAKSMAFIQENVAKLQDGRSSTILLPSDRDSSGNPLYDLDIVGIDGGGKQYKTSEIIDQKKKAILNCWQAGHTILGQDGMGSNALFNGADLNHAAHCTSVVEEALDVINTQLIPRILTANGIFPDWKDMPKYVAADVVGISWDEMGKFIQRVASVQKLTPAQYKYLTALVPGMPEDGIDDLDYTDKGASRSGESLGTSGTGNTQSNGKNSSLNVENKSLYNFIEIQRSENSVTLLDTETDEVHTIPRGQH